MLPFTKSKPHVSYGLWIAILYPCGSITCKKCTPLVWDVDSGRDCAYVGQGICKNSLCFSLNVAVNCCEKQSVGGRNKQTNLQVLRKPFPLWGESTSKAKVTAFLMGTMN